MIRFRRFPFSTKAIIVLLVFLASLPATALAEETLSVTVRNDTVTIWNRNVEFSCNSVFRFNLRLSGDTLEGTEVDTARDHATCLCFFQLSVTVVGLPSGRYFVPVYRRYYLVYPNATTMFVGMTEFTVGQSTPPLTQRSYQSACSQEPLAVLNASSPPKEFTLHQNYPNPFNPVTNFQFQIVNRQLTILKVYDVLGREVATLVNEVKAPGRHEITFDASGLASGVYFYRLRANGVVQGRKMVVQK